jgi:hypothetical protein
MSFLLGACVQAMHEMLALKCHDRKTGKRGLVLEVSGDAWCTLACKATTVASVLPGHQQRSACHATAHSI